MKKYAIIKEKRRAFMAPISLDQLMMIVEK
jgi:hypothetical protein